jgi:5'-methylthioadenosine phosphorylase
LSNRPHSGSSVAIIAGTGFEDAFGIAQKPLTITTPYGETTVFGIEDHALPLFFVPRHGTSHAVPPHRINYRAQIWALNSLGVSRIIATAAAGSLRSDLLPGEIVILNDFIDLRGEPTTFFDGEQESIKHTDFSEPFSPVLRNYLIACAKEMNAEGYNRCSIHETGTYICTSGPRYETPAEVKAYGLWGGDVVGMTVAPEAILAQELGISYAVAAVVTNMGTGLSKGKVSHEDVSAQMLKNQIFLVDMFRRTANKLFDSIGS